MNTLSVSSARAGRALNVLFFVEMALSPLVAAIALLVPVAVDRGLFNYVPATVWLLLFVQCLVSFRWRGLWFVLGVPVAFVAIEAFLVAVPPVPQRKIGAATSGPENQSGMKVQQIGYRSL